MKRACLARAQRGRRKARGDGGGHAGGVLAHGSLTRGIGPPRAAVPVAHYRGAVDVDRRGIRVPRRDAKPGRALRSAYLRDRDGGLVRRGLRRHRPADLAKPAAESRAAGVANPHRGSARPELGAERERGARAQLPQVAGRRGPVHRQRRPRHLRQRRLLRACRPPPRTACRRPGHSAGAGAARPGHATRRQPLPRPEDRRRQRRPLDRLARRAGAQWRQDRNAERRP